MACRMGVKIFHDASSSSSRTKLLWSPLSASRINASYASGMRMFCSASGVGLAQLGTHSVTGACGSLLTSKRCLYVRSRSAGKELENDPSRPGVFALIL